jgi:hypothetical protein
MLFEEFMGKVYEFTDMINEIEAIDWDWDDGGASIGCDCGCGGDTFDWEGQALAYERKKKLELESQEFYEELRKEWNNR